jgi:GNAT superfamily N-acetyltransferase
MTPTIDPWNQKPLTLPVTMLGIAGALFVLWSVYEGAALWVNGSPLRTPVAPRGIVSLALAPTESEAQAIIAEWGCGSASEKSPDAGRCPVARGAVARDYRFIAAYFLGWVLIAIWAWIAGPTTNRILALVLAGIAIGALLDLVENRLLTQALEHTAAIDPAQLFRRIRLAAMNKFVLLLLGVAGGVAMGFGALRRVLVLRRLRKARETAAEATATGPGGKQPPALPQPTFGALVQAETDGIFATFEKPGTRTADKPVLAINTAADEAYVPFREADLIGLALSGGGIRSATFNLGLLQELHCLKLLPLVDYLSTVSGGGYIGSFWSAWLTRLPALMKAQLKKNGQEEVAEDSPEWNERRNARLFPSAGELGPGPGQHVESREERHLREFSGFLAPRWGFFEVDTWTAIVALLAGLVPALLIGWSVIGLTLIAWLALTFPLASSQMDGAPALTIAVVTTAVLLLFERMWQEFRRETAATKDDPAVRTPLHGTRFYRGCVVFVVALVAVLQGLLRWVYTSHEQGPWPLLTRGDLNFWHAAPNASGIVRWWAITGIDNPGHPWVLSPRLFDYGLVWLAAGLVLIAARTSSAIMPEPWKSESLATLDRVLMRTLGMGTAWIGLSLLWHVSVNLPGLATVGISATISGTVFAALRNWIGLALRRPAEAGILDRLKPMLPALLAYLTLVLTAITVGGVLVALGRTDWFSWWLMSAAMITMLVIGLFITPDQFGMHAFYRDRIARAYAGAINLGDGLGAESNRGTEPRDGDNPRFTDLVPRPLHLVCCAANDLSGDQVETLNRGARSAVLSRYGFSFGRYAHEWPEQVPINRLASGITASAAAFNSNMGHISVRVGPAVSFLMTMLNLRLGLWVRHPLAVQAGPRRWPGLLYYREMLGLTSSSGRMPEVEVPKSVMRDIHLSDGGHFENLALYELVRRHCRYIIVSDCGADPDVAFDDLGNALRRIREDFGVEVELDVAPLRPDPVTRLSQQHVAAGRIKYSETDTGILLYVKPSITGDEPPDVQQYRTRNLAFPHEATTDQFYDEAQWESYRRLGRHAAEHIFAFIRRSGTQRLTADWVFAEAARAWGPTPEGLEERVLEMTQRFAAVDAELQQRQQQAMLQDVFPEVRDIVGDRKKSPPSEGTGARAPVASSQETLAAELSILLKVMQVMEDVWMACQLDRWWSHPLNLGWINLFARWATSPPFQFWWPLLSPMFSPGFRTFIEQRFPRREGTGAKTAIIQRGEVEEVAQGDIAGLAETWWKQRSAQPMPWTRPLSAPFTRRLYQDRLELVRDQASVRIQVGLAAVTFTAGMAGWTSDDFFVPPSLWGAGIGGHFLRGLLDRVSKEALIGVVVVKAPPPGQDHQVARDDRQAFVEHYKKVGFREKRIIDTEVERALCGELGYDTDRDTLMTLDLPQWRARMQVKAT